MNPLVAKLKEKLLPEFEKIASRINRTIPNVIANVESHEVGTLTEYQGYSFCISVLFKSDILYTAEETADNVALVVTLCYLTTTPEIFAYVCWGHPSGYSEAEFPKCMEGHSQNSLIVSDEVLAELYKGLPRLYTALFAALKRRKPGDE